MRIIKKILWRIKFLLLQAWGMDPSVVLYTVFPFIRSGAHARERLLVRKGVLGWNEAQHSLSFRGLTIYYGKKAPITDVLSIFLYTHPFIQKNFIQNSAFPFEGPYEQGAVTIAPGDTVIDAGANIGVFSALASQKAGKAGHVIAFEPIEEARVLLEKNIKANSLVNTTAVPYALGDERKKVLFSKDEGLLGSSRVFEKGSASEEVEQCTLDAYVADNNIAKVDFIKADIEGMERFLLAGAEQVIRKHKPKIAICIYHLPDDPLVIEGLLRSFVPEYIFERTATKLFAHV